MRKQRTRIISYTKQVPLVQYQFKEFSDAWVDAPWYIFNLSELRAYLSGKGIYNVKGRVIAAYKQTDSAI